MAASTGKGQAGDTQRQRAVRTALEKGSRGTSLNLSSESLRITPGLRAVPSAVWSLSHLTQLDLSANQLAALPEALGALRALEGLDASRNVISRLPAALGTLARLDVLRLHDNRLRGLPREMSPLGQTLRLLTLRGNSGLPQAAALISTDRQGRIDRSRWTAYFASAAPAAAEHPAEVQDRKSVV